MAIQLVRPATAFQETSRRRKHPRVKSEGYLAFIRSLPCVITGGYPVEAAHIRFGDMAYGKRGTGAAEKPDDRWCLPLTPDMHRSQHARGDERAWWAEAGIDPLPLCLALYTCGEDHDIATAIIRAANEKYTAVRMEEEGFRRGGAT